ncbi:Transferase [Macleaya cordata]|uniref:Transferase n=1 Tax=Macleaya cordata TaxID=56857 RepID=A0A200RDJ2_MACCD|nr:Transferase [Macleaya cordata]
MSQPAHSDQQVITTRQLESSKHSEQEETNIISHLKTSLSRALDHFFPLAGRLAITNHDDDDDGTISVYINCNYTGAEFIHAAADVTIADILDPTYVPRMVFSFFSLNGVINYEGRSKPLLSIQISRSGFNHISHPPVFERWFVDNTNCPIRLPFSTDDERLIENILHHLQLKREFFISQQKALQNLKQRPTYY